ILRTVILEEEGNAYQHVKEPHGWEFSIIDGNNYKENGKGLQQYIEKIISVPFDLSRDFMLRATLINLSEQEHVLVIIMHHIASDGWSISVLVKEVVELYTSYEEDRPMLLPPLKVQYADYAIWQRKYLEGEMLKGMMEYWKKKLSGVQPLELPSDFARPAVQSMQGATISFRIDKEIALQLQQLNQQQGTTMFMTLLAIFKVLLFKHSGQKDICVGTPSANRTQEELEAMIGFFINTLALRTEVSSEVSFLELLQQVKTTTLEAYANQDAPFEKIVEAIVRERDMSRSPLFQVMFMLQNTPNAPKVNLGELQLSNEAFAQDTTKYDLMFGLTETSSGFQGTLQYSTALYKEDTIQRMIGHFKELIHSVVREPGQQVGDLSIITEIERQQLLSFNKSEEEDKKYKTIIELFEEQVLKSPDSIALVFEDARLTYTELNGRANQLAHYLRERGVKRQELVPICIGRSLEMIVGILAILKAGGAYVPIDPEYPAERTGYMLEDINASIVLGSEATRLRIQTAKTIEIIELDVDWSVISNQSIDNPGIVSAPDHLAYVIYTSGSTGRPKGVLIEQKSVVSLVKDASYVSLSKDDILLSTGSSSFDATTFEYWSMFLNGGKLVLCSENKLLDNTLLKKEISENHITKMWFTSSWFNQLVEADISIFKGLDAILVGGEKLSEPHIKRVKETYSSIDIINGYGPTENTTFSLTCNITADDLSGTIPIGRPLKDRTAYILDEKRRMVPVGIIGEICLGGSGLARGYLNRTELTAEKFIDHPFSKKQGERLYKTGDLGRWLPDGNIEYLGRLDEQVKIRGYRIELGEIETVLMQSGLLSQAVVLSKEDNLGQKRLVGYLVPANELFDKQAISSYLHGKLPDYMVPALWVELKNLPLTANGKIDKRALPNPDVNELLAHEYTAPRNDMEATLAEIWQQLLGIERIGVHDNFFEVGGHSLLAMRVVSSIRRVMELEVAIKELFVHPTIGELATYLQGQDKGSLLPPIEVIQPRPGQVPLSFSQERLWFIDRLEGSVQYHLPSILRMKGKLNKDGLANALQVIVNRHEVLRTVIREHEGQALQYIIDQDKWQLSIVDGSIYKEDPQALRLYIHQLIIQPFDLSRDYMIRATLIKVDEEDHVLVAIMHHISSDAWSTSILVKEVVELYSSYEEGRQSTLAPVPLQYADYAIWQRNYLRGEILDKKINYWKDKLSGTSSLQMATDYPRPAVQSMRGAIRGFWIDKELSGKLRQLSQQSGTTLFMTMLAAFKVLLYRYSAQQDICVGTSIASRQQNEVEELIGFFVNTLVLRTEVSGDLSFKELLQNVKSTTLDAYANQEVPFEKIVETVVKERNVSRNPLFQVFFVLQNTPEVPTLKLGQVQLSGEGYELTTTQFDLMFNIRDSSLGLQGSIQYSTDLYNETTINRMIAHFQELLQSIVQTPEQTIGALRILPPEEEHELLTGFNNTKLEIPKYRDIIDLFSEQVAKTPSAVALVFEDQELTYQQLNERSGQLAHFLSSKGVKKETRVPIYIERGIDMLVGILGILKSGGAYVPIDPAYPQERISYILEDTEATIVISNSLNSSKLNTASLEVVELDTTWDMISKYPSGSLPGNITSAQLAYIIYTSGSTGKPKGVMIEHHSLMHYLLNSKASYINKEQHGSGSFIHLSYTFDASLTGMFMPLLFGRKVVIASKQFIDVFEDSNLHKYAPYDFIKITPTHLELLQNKLNISNGKLLTDRLVIGGEALKPGHFAYMIQQGIDVEIINEYGPTEATVGCSTYCFRTIGDQERIKNGILIGKPIDNIQLYILRENFALAPIGVRGEICIAGDGLARGYLNRAELTEEKFVTNPFSEEEGSKMYRTGDLGRWLPDGNMEYLGRIDDQVKIRGYRIELGEIESVLMQSESIKQAVVLAKEDKSGNQRLVGYIVTAEDFDNNAIISYLQGRLPDYMVPTLWIKLESLPVTPNGKVDKKALPDPDTSGISINEYAVPRNEVENKLTDIWKQLLDIDQVGIYNDFFELGGHSLLAIRVISAIRKQFEIELKINDVFEYPTIAQLAGYLQSHSSKNVHHAIERVEPQPENIPLSFSQERLWFIDQLEGSTQYHLPTVLRLQGKVNIEALEYAIQNVINRHDILRTVIMDLDGKPYQHIQDKDHWKISRIDGLIFKNDAATLQQFTQKIIQQPFDLSKDSMVRGALITIDELNHVLVITMHHIVSDGWSLSIIVKEVAEAYNAYEEGRPLNLPELQIQYADYAIWQRQHLHGENWDKKIAYWKEQLTGVTPLQLQTDYERPSIQSARGAVIPFRIEKEALDQMQLLSQQNGTTLFMTLLAAFKILLYRYSGQLDICVGTPIANRPQQELEELIGFFVNTLALRTEISRSASFLDLLQHVKSTTMGAFANQDVPFETVVNEVVRERDMSRSPLFQVTFSLQNTPEVPALRLGEIHLRGEAITLNSTKFDLSFNLTENIHGLQGSVIYCIDLYTASTVEQMIRHFKELIYSILRNPAEHISSLSMLGPADQYELLVGLNNAASAEAGGHSIVDLFEIQVLKTPEAIALVYEGENLSYYELNERANQLAHYLRSKGVGHETLVPICIERGISMLTGILGILKAGGAYVPINPDYPSERISYILSDIGATIIISSRISRTKVPKEHNIIVVEDDQALISSQATVNLQVAGSGNQLAYVIYTSGSTGKPKGVMVEHNSITSLIATQSRYFNITPDDRILQFADYTFDASVEQIFLTLLNGATLVMFSEGLQMDMELFEAFIKDNRVSHLHATPLFLENLPVGDYPSLKRIIAGGDVCKPILSNRWKSKLDFYNEYGPTETTVTAIEYRVGDKDQKHNAVPIGRPLPNTVVYLLDEFQGLVPLGATGEIYIGGVQVARGYVNRPDLTAERFIKDPFSTVPGA
ncbi:MAG: amino acid adenylation domain-containing protein, partial [Ferruginibacter sp.]